MSEHQRILGIDFTSAPSLKKPLTCVIANFDGLCLEFEQLVHWSSFDEFEAALVSPGPWIAAIDFPFAQASPARAQRATLSHLRNVDLRIDGFYFGVVMRSGVTQP